MYAVVKSGGKQHKVEVGETVSVELLDAEAGSVVTLPALLVSDGENITAGSDAAAATVTAEVLGHGKADKVVVFKFKKRKGSKKLRGHRQNLTLLRVTDIAVGGKKAPAKQAAAEAEPVAEVVVEKPAAKKALAAKKPAAAKAAAPADEKPAAKRAPAAKAAANPAAEKAAAKPAAKKAPAAKKETDVKKPAAKKPAAKKTEKPAE